VDLGYDCFCEKKNGIEAGVFIEGFHGRGVKEPNRNSEFARDFLLFGRVPVC
jgi:hypothetical protein